MTDLAPGQAHTRWRGRRTVASMHCGACGAKPGWLCTNIKPGTWPVQTTCHLERRQALKRLRFRESPA